MDDLLLQVEPMIPALRRYARGLVRDIEAADDIVQDCLEKVVLNWSRRRDDNPRSWAFAILHNLAVNRLRQDARRGGSVPIEDVPEATGARAATQEDTVYGHEVMAAIERLPPDQRSILLLISVEDLTYAEAAKVLEIPLGTVMSRLSRAREQLRTILETKPSGGSAGRPYIWRVK
ncbi:RNA polymerase sigma factor [Rhizobium johnstonii]|uniref:RNA polymerase sigma factor n=1 Tax=Rhizobium TaxID=379 RepID=UPI001032221C|nr:RNA polymerase sigma factor [Rhizobium leguminosarum]TBF97999.1 RNA polymerase sigma factor [Rhizobium leguminosarum]TBG67151.1 RNA polymerase sigma factor [Rhizobium leguminosarum]TBH10444.1 RNA polymerase sigma factor [Rhizobium leguminosarum]TBH35193.1 RNA polymerase sigma factor [Rhizobium leguminosarum]TBH57673.1 RNA polymerase sigma factor [Rhizobium leguminosarum]